MLSKAHNEPLSIFYAFSFENAVTAKIMQGAWYKGRWALQRFHGDYAVLAGNFWNFYEVVKHKSRNLGWQIRS